ncbi:methionine aminopeptidase, type I [Saprospira grandis DSM 2844]|uniref:Methionine aminopeptidase n=1 Tax=Saprospira grandis DSM 2844 TaxID=694433 RepID=J0XZ01_9BACT|nr:type I methionyl aminopeptidase [Saprospira grandis]EJF54401.1 methionine aminopeptidase, type I [Saprospira grandis DSM 2844]
MIIYKTKEQIELVRKSALLVSKTLGMLASEIKPGVTPKHLDQLAEAFIRDHAGKPGFLGLYGCPSTLLTSVNEQVVHGLPTDRPLENGDIIAVDCGVFMNGFYGDHAYTFPVGDISDERQRLLDTTLECLYRGIEQTCKGKRLGDIGHAIQALAEERGYGVVRELVGHGLGKKMHEDPQVPNYGRQGHGKKIKEGLVIAIEPMINMGTHKVHTLADNWTISTIDGQPSAHFEHNVAVVNGKPEILSTFDYVEEVLGERAALKHNKVL